MSQLVCSKCGSQNLKKKFFSGMRACQDCKQGHGLTTGQKVLYWFLLFVIVTTIIGAWASGGWAVPGLAFVAIIYALIKSATLPKCAVAPKRITPG